MMAGIKYPGKYFPPEWYDQDAVLLTWPHGKTDWAAILPEVQRTYLEIAREIIQRERLIITTPDQASVRSLFSEEETKRILFLEMPSNDTWARDLGPISVFSDRKPVICDFRFNGWGNKFHALLDNQITGKIFKQNIFTPETEYQDHSDFILEGGSIETDGRGTLLTTSECLLNRNRNADYRKSEIEARLKNSLGVDRFLWLDHGYLEGDDTDSHIDTLARFCNENTICYVQCTNEEDVHFPELRKMEQQLQKFRTVEDKPYHLEALPMAKPVFDSDGHRMPATYANFLIINKAVLVPVYGQQEDDEALEILGKIFPGRQIIGVNCLSLIKQNGSLHCITMQIPKGFLK